MFKKITSSGLGFVLLVSPVFASADALSDLQAQIRSLLAQIASLQSQIGAPPTSSASTGVACVSLSNSLSLDDTDADTNGDVTKLQRFLASQGGSVYPERRITGYFGPATLRAVQRWQAAHGLVSSGDPDSTGYGYVGPKTRTAMAQRCSNISSTPASTPIPIITIGNIPSPYVAPAVELLSPAQGFTVSRKGKMTISWRASTDKRRIVTGAITLISTPNTNNPHPVGSVSGSGFMKTIEPGTHYGTFEQDWGLNDSVPGTYAVSLALRDCSPKGCDQNPDFPEPGYGPVQTHATSHSVTFTVIDDDVRAPLSISWRDKIFLLGTGLKQDTAQKLCDAAAVTIDSYTNIVCRWGQQVLTSNGVKDGGTYISITKPYPNDYLQKNTPAYSIEFLDPTGQAGDVYVVYFRTFSGSGVSNIYERTPTNVEKKTNGVTSASIYIGDLPIGDYYLDILNVNTGAHGGVGAYVFVR